MENAVSAKWAIFEIVRATVTRKKIKNAPITKTTFKNNVWFVFQVSEFKISNASAANKRTVPVKHVCTLDKSIID